jgi:hypothetical protein
MSGFCTQEALLAGKSGPAGFQGLVFRGAEGGEKAIYFPFVCPPVKPGPSLWVEIHSN